MKIFQAWCAIVLLALAGTAMRTILGSELVREAVFK